MAALSGVEKGLEGLYKNAPSLPENGKKGIVNAMPWIVLVLGILQLLSAWWLWDWGRKANKVADAVNQIATYYNVQSTTVKLGITYWISLLLIVVIAVVLLMSYKGLKERSKKKGWDMLFLVAMINLVYGIFYLFTDRGGVTGLIGALLGSAISLYFLFQIKSFYNGHTVHHVEATPKA